MPSRPRKVPTGVNSLEFELYLEDALVVRAGVSLEVDGISTAAFCVYCLGVSARLIRIPKP